MTFYATRDTDPNNEQGWIEEGADIRAFNTRAEAEAYLREPFDPAEWSVEITTGEFSEYWRRFYSEPNSLDTFEPFEQNDVTIRGPGSHPGGRQWWITPPFGVEILIAVETPLGDWS